MKKILKLALQGNLITLLACSVLLANEETVTIEQEDVVVVGTKTEHSVFDTPGVATTIDTNSLENSFANDLNSVFKNEAGISVTGTRKNGQNLTMRGYRSESIAFLVDGVPQNFYSAHDGTLFIDPTLMQSVEVAYGSSSSLYGSGGLGGTVLFKTYDAKDLLMQGQNHGSSVGLGYSSVNNEYLVTAKTYGVTEKSDYLFATTYADSGNINLGGDATSLQSEDKITSMLAKTSYYMNDNHALKLNVNYYNSDAKEPNNPREIQTEGGHMVVSDEPLDKYTKNLNTSLSHVYTKGDYIANTGLYFQGISLDEYVQNDDPMLADYSGNIAGDILDRDYYSLGIYTDARAKFDFIGLNNVLVYGLNLRQEEQDSSHSRFGNVNGVPKASANYYDGYMQTESSLGGFTLLAGANYSYYDSSNTGGLDNSDSALSPKVGLSYNNDYVTLFTNYSYGFRAPKMTELYASGEHFAYTMGPAVGQNNFVENPDLKPETNKTFEVGAGLKFDAIGLSMKASYYNTDSENYIDIAVVDDGPDLPMFGIDTEDDYTIYLNVDSVKIQGVNADIKYELQAFEISLKYSYVDGEDTSDPTNILPLETIAPHTFVALASYNLGASSFSVRGTFVDGYTRYNVSRGSSRATGEDMAGYGLLDAYYGYNFNEAMSLKLGVENILDKEYAVLTSYYVQEGRNYTVFFNYKF